MLMENIAQDGPFLSVADYFIVLRILFSGRGVAVYILVIDARRFVRRIICLGAMSLRFRLASPRGDRPRGVCNIDSLIYVVQPCPAQARALLPKPSLRRALVGFHGRSARTSRPPAPACGTHEHVMARDTSAGPARPPRNAGRRRLAFSSLRLASRTVCLYLLVASQNKS